MKIGRFESVIFQPGCIVAFVLIGDAPSIGDIIKLRGCDVKITKVSISRGIGVNLRRRARGVLPAEYALKFDGENGNDTDSE